MNPECVFCKIVKGEVPCTKIYETENFLAFLDIQPVSHGHTLVIPKNHVVWMQDADDETVGEIFKVSKKIMLAMKKGLQCDYVYVGVEGKDVPHFHVHLTPRFYDDGLGTWPTKEYGEGEPAEIANKISSSISQ
ncbi:MAG TPA: HIT domain-containing protein [Flavobacterium sp.]|nr:HIT domain-containing protein [Flavobacterium sp.]